MKKVDGHFPALSMLKILTRGITPIGLITAGGLTSAGGIMSTSKVMTKKAKTYRGD